ncbi:MAG: cytochrome P450 [Leeuwenhoekiella sp.]|nr:cytochrome P450 [Leeuwenhoekiella sp.]
MGKAFPKVSIFQFLRSALSILKNPLPFHHRNFESKGNTFQLKIGFTRSVLFSRDAHFAQHALQKNQKKYQKSPIQTRDLAKYVGQGLLTANGKHWAKQRKLIQPAFQKKTLHGLLQKVDEVIQKELVKIETGKAFDIFPIFNDLAFNTVVQALFSNVIDQKAINRLQHITESNQRMMVKELRQPYLNWWFHVSGALKSALKQSLEARQILSKLIDDRIASGIRHDDLLDMLLDARYEDDTPMSREQLIDEILILFIAGHETTSNALTFTAALLARNPEVQDKLYAESLAADNEVDLLEKIKTLKYTNQVVNEAMRLYPPAYFIDRISIEKDQFDDFEIEAGTNILFSIFEIHRHTDFWERPEEFNPDRFADDSLKYSPYYYPFGAGPRMCIGNNFAMYEMILTVSHLVKKFKIKKETAPIEINPLITLKPKDVLLTFTPRDFEY